MLCPLARVDLCKVGGLGWEERACARVCAAAAFVCVRVCGWFPAACACPQARCVLCWVHVCVCVLMRALGTLQDDPEEYIIVGTCVVGGPDEEEPKKGRIIVLSVPSSASMGKHVLCVLCLSVLCVRVVCVLCCVCVCACVCAC